MTWSDFSSNMADGLSAMFDGVVFSVASTREGATVNHPRIPDPDRPGFSFPGSIDPHARIPEGALAGSPQAAPNARSTRITYDAAVTAFSANHPRPIHRGDILTVASAPDQAMIDRRWIVADIHDDGTGRVLYYVNRAKPA